MIEERILRALVYMEANVDREISLEEVAKIACYSPTHFHRIFQALVGEPVYQYVRRLKLERAAGLLRYTKKSVTEIALDTYDTPSAFTKAFKQFMGQSPKNYRSLSTDAVSAMRRTIKEFPMIHPDKIEKHLPDLQLLFIRKWGSYKTTPALAWKSMNEFIEESKLNRTHIRFFSISYDDPNVTSEEKLRFDAAILASGVKERGEVGRQVLKGGKFAIFTHHGPYEGLFDAFSRIFIKWLPASREKNDESRMVFCEHFLMETVKTDPSKLVTKLYIPLL